MKGWDPERRCYVEIRPDLRGRMVGPTTITGVGADMSWLGEPMTDAEAQQYETTRAARIAAHERGE